MNTGNDKPNFRKPDPSIELEVFDLGPDEAAPKHTVDHFQEMTPAFEPIPANPLHLCPNCNYNLTGLTSRICPECGETFDVLDARDHARSKPLPFTLPEWKHTRLAVITAVVIGGCLISQIDVDTTKKPYVTWQWNQSGLALWLVGCFVLWGAFIIFIKRELETSELVFTLIVMLLFLAMTAVFI